MMSNWHIHAIYFQFYFQFVYGVLQWSAQVFIGEASWDRGSRLLSVGEGPQQIRLKGGRNRDLMKKALQVPKRKQESWKLISGGLGGLDVRILMPVWEENDALAGWFWHVLFYVFQF